MSSNASERTGRNTSVRHIARRRLTDLAADGCSLGMRSISWLFKASPAILLMIAALVLIDAFAGREPPREIRNLPFADDLMMERAKFDCIDTQPSIALTDEMALLAKNTTLLDNEIAAIENEVDGTVEEISIISTERERDPTERDLLVTQRELNGTRRELIALQRELIDEQAILKERRQELSADIDAETITNGERVQAERVMFASGLIAAALSLLITPFLIRRVRDLSNLGETPSQPGAVADRPPNRFKQPASALRSRIAGGDRGERRHYLWGALFFALLILRVLYWLWPQTLAVAALCIVLGSLPLSVHAWNRIAYGSGTLSTRSPSDPHVRPNRIHYSRRRNGALVNSIRDRLNSSEQFVFAILFTMFPSIWRNILKPNGSEVEITEIVIDVVAAFLIGILAWHMFVIGRGIFQIGDQLEINPNHRDNAGGLSPFGDLCWWNVLPIIIAATYLGGWLIVAPHISPPYKAQADAFSQPFRTMLAFLVPFILVCFLLPLFRIHRRLADYHEQTALQPSSRQAPSTDMTDRTQVGGDQSAKASNTTSTTNQNRLTRTWPIDTVLIRKLVGSLTVPVLGLLGLGDPLLGIAGSLVALTN